MGARAWSAPQTPRNVNYEFIKWLVERGVAWGAGNRFAMATRCSNCEEAAIYLRLQLPPLQLGNSDAIDDEMRELLECGGDVARRVIQDLDVFSARPAAQPHCGPPACRRHCTQLRGVLVSAPP